MKKRIFFGLILVVIAAGGGWALDFTKLPDNLAKGNMLGGIGLGFGTGPSTNMFHGGENSLLLPVVIETDWFIDGPFSLGAEVDMIFSNLTFPILARFGYHPNLGVKNLNIYLLAKAGYNLSLLGWSSFGFGFDLGVRYFFAPSVGIYAEFGYDGICQRGGRFVTIGITTNGNMLGSLFGNSSGK
jgi:hypothetical protein